MASDTKYSLWLRPFGDTAFRLQQRIKDLAAKYDTPVFEPHITLVNGLTHSETELTQLTDTLATSLHPFEVVLTTAGTKDYYYQALFVHVQENDALMNARSTAEKLFDCHYERDFFPHLSLMYGDLGTEEKERILNTMGREFHLRFPVHSLLLVETGGEPDDWKKIHSAEFSKAQSA